MTKDADQSVCEVNALEDLTGNMINSITGRSKGKLLSLICIVHENYFSDFSLDFYCPLAQLHPWRRAHLHEIKIDNVDELPRIAHSFLGKCAPGSGLKITFPMPAKRKWLAEHKHWVGLKTTISKTETVAIAPNLPIS